MTEPAPLRALAALGAAVPWPDADAERAARAHRLPVGPGRPRTPFGQLTALGEWLAGVQGTWPPAEPRDPRLVVVTATHVGAAGRTVDDPEQVRRALADRTLPALRLAADDGVRVEVVDAGEVGAVDREDASLLTRVLDGIDLGAALADRLVDEGADLVAVTEVAAGASTAAAAVIAVLTLSEPTTVAGRGSGLDDAGWAVKTAAIRDARSRAAGERGDVERLLARIGGRDLAVLLGLVLQAAVRRTPVLLDGVSAVAATVVAREISPRILRWVRLAQRGTDLAEAHAAHRIGLNPVVDAGLTGVGVTAGVGALLALREVRVASRLSAGPLALGPAADPVPDPAADPAPDPAAQDPAAPDPTAPAGIDVSSNDTPDAAPGSPADPAG